MSERLDAIKLRAKVVATKPEIHSSTYAEFGAALRLACFDVPALVAAVEAVLALPTALSRDMHSTDYNRGLFAAKRAIREALGEKQ